MSCPLTLNTAITRGDGNAAIGPTHPTTYSRLNGVQHCVTSTPRVYLQHQLLVGLGQPRPLAQSVHT